MSPVVEIWDEPCFLKLISVSLNPPQLVVDYTVVPHSFAGGGGNFSAIYAKINGLSKVTNDFKPTLGIPDEISYEQFKRAYNRNKKYCQLGVWSIHFPKENFDLIEPFVFTYGNKWQFIRLCII